MMPTFMWHPPNIRALPGAEWTAQHRLYVPQTDPDKWGQAFGPWQPGLLAAEGCKPATGWKMPSSPGEGFYKYLRKNYRKNAAGEYV